MTKVKICGFTEAENAREAAIVGVDAVGLVFYDKSPRNVDILRAQEIIAVSYTHLTLPTKRIV